MTAVGVNDAAGAVVPEIDDPLSVLERIDEGFYAIDRDWRLVYVNARAEAFWGRKRQDLVGHSMLDLFTRFAGSPAWQAHQDAMVSGRPARVETTSTAIGRPVELRLFPSAGGLSVYFRDLSDRRALELELKTREDLLALAELSAGIGVWVADLRTETLQATPQFFRLLGLEPIAGPVSQDLPRSMRHPDDRDRVTTGFREAIASGADVFESEYRIIKPTGEQRWIFGRGRVTRDADGKPWRYAGIDLDVTDRKAQDEHLRMVMGELLHRTNNLLAVVQGVATQTGRNAPDIRSFLDTFNARLSGLAQSNGLIARGEWRGAGLEALARAQTGNFTEAHRIVIEGPPVTLSPKAVQNLGLAFHELATNALKYGAWSVPHGQVRISWSLADDGLLVSWIERGGPRLAEPKRMGFGRVVAEQMLVRALGAKVETRFAPEGLEWSLLLPASELKPDSSI